MAKKIASKAEVVIKAKPAKKVTTKKPTKSIEKDAPMKIFSCETCKKKFPDMLDYFYGKKSKKCMWCTKFPKDKK